MKAMMVVSLAAGALLLPAGTQAQDAKTKAMNLFAAQKCTQCHSIAGRGNKKGALDDVGRKLTAAEIKEWITDPVGMAKKTDQPPTRKPPMKKKALSGDDVNALVDDLATLKG